MAKWMFMSRNYTKMLKIETFFKWISWGFVILNLCYVNFVTGDQVCYNCGTGTTCSNDVISKPNIGLDSDCWDMCNTRAYCTKATLDYTSVCRLFNCSQVTQHIGSKSYIKTSNTDCPEFEIFIHWGYATNCIVMEFKTTATFEQCLSTCLEKPLCRGLTFDSTTLVCNLHSNSGCLSQTMTSDNNKVYAQRLCMDEQPPCDRTFTQKCVNCRVGGLCYRAYNQTWDNTPLNISTQDIGVIPELLQIWYNPVGSASLYQQCSMVSQEVGHTVYRASCKQDCPTYELITLNGHQGTCGFMATFSGGLSIDFCMAECLDMDDCRGVTFDISNSSCTFHRCIDYTVDSSYNFIARRCVNESSPECPAANAIIQTCRGCAPGPVCPTPFKHKKFVTRYENCYNIKAAENESLVAFYNRSKSFCDLYQCSMVQQSMADVVYRQTCNPDCPEFEMFEVTGYAGTCDVIEMEEGGFTFHYCIEKCLDLTGCRGTTYNSANGKCEYHSCANYTASPDLQFMWKRCIDEPPAVRPYNQICEGCHKSVQCSFRTGFINTNTWQECRDEFINSTDDNAVYVFDGNITACSRYNCSWLQQDGGMFRTAFRKSYSQFCPVFRLLHMVGFMGTCPIIGYLEGGVSDDYCVDKCLDMDNCTAVTHDNIQNSCTFHSCIEKEAKANYTFVKRVCMAESELSPVKNYTQTCVNCGIQCNKTISTTQTLLSSCSATCPDCDSILFEPSLDRCTQFYCDRPFILGEGTYLMRRTSNPDCLNFELMLNFGYAPNCAAFAYDEGKVNANFCLKRCFDMPGCRSVFMDGPGLNCTYHACEESVRISGLVLIATKKCYPDVCTTPTTQTCLNCEQGTMCQSQFKSSSTLSSATCQAECEMEPECEGAVYEAENMECNLFQCSHVNIQYESTFFRDSCNDDCPIYEVYMLDSQFGTCPIIENMTEYAVWYPDVCYQRCLDTVGCRGVSYLKTLFMCYYHTDCDCHSRFEALPLTFWWRYCLNDTASASVLPNSTQGLDEALLYPTSPVCKPLPIYITACLCSTGAFGQLTTGEIVEQLIENLTIDYTTTSANIRKYTSAQDNRKSAVAVGTVGIVILVGITAGVVMFDVPNVIQFVRRHGMRRTHSLGNTVKEKKKNKKDNRLKKQRKTTTLGESTGTLETGI